LCDIEWELDFTDLTDKFQTFHSGRDGIQRTHTNIIECSHWCYQYHSNTCISAL